MPTGNSPRKVACPTSTDAQWHCARELQLRQGCRGAIHQGRLLARREAMRNALNGIPRGINSWGGEIQH